MRELVQIKKSIYYAFKDLLVLNNYGYLGYNNNEVVTLIESNLSDEDVNKIVSRSSASGLTEVEVVLPVVVFDYSNQYGVAFELGSNDATNRSFLVQIFANNSVERDELSQLFYEYLRDNNIAIYNYNAGFPPDVTPTKVGILDIDNVGLTPVFSSGSTNIAERYKAEVVFDARFYSSLPSDSVFT